MKFARNVKSDQANGFIRFRTTMTMRSFGENVLLSMSELDSDFTKVVISSKCVVSTTLIDYAKNAENMRLIAGSIKDAEKRFLQKKLLD